MVTLYAEASFINVVRDGWRSLDSYSPIILSDIPIIIAASRRVNPAFARDVFSLCANPSTIFFSYLQ